MAGTERKGVLFVHLALVAYGIYRLLISRLTGVYLERIKKSKSQECWWCGHKRQTRDHLFKWCNKWKRQQDDLWKKLRKKCKWKERRKVPMSQVFDTDDAVKAVLKFLKETDVGRVSFPGVADEG
ncbi:hypothetical protein BDD12DRAFT_895343 [Trichophaea hybrida]|nr:hypothetical protein BDD12DRAFT_895343 [Trichophaea hybrida]